MPKKLAPVAVFLLCSVSAPAALKTIAVPQGGKIVYGQVEGAGSEAGAMGTVLREVHAQLGDRPRVGRIFRVHGTNSVAVFFTVTRRNQGNAQLAGMLIAATFSPGHVEAALLSDDAARFGSSINPMLKQLLDVWRPAGDARPAASGGAVAALRPITLPDRSASVSLPDGWNVLPSSGGGTILAQGPNGEAVFLGFPFLAMNSSDPRVQQTMRWAQQGGRNTSYAQALYYPYGADLAKTYVDLTQMWRGKQRLPPASFQIGHEEPVALPPAERCSHITGQVDAQDGKGPKELNSVFCQGPLAAHGSFMNLAYHTAVPVKYAPAERAFMAAVLASFNVNTAVVDARKRGPWLLRPSPPSTRSADAPRSRPPTRTPPTIATIAAWNNVGTRRTSAIRPSAITCWTRP